MLVGNSLGALATLRAAGPGVPLAAAVLLSEPFAGDNALLRAFRHERLTLPLRALTVRWAVPARLARPFVVRLVATTVGRAANDLGFAGRLADHMLSMGLHEVVRTRASATGSQ